MKALPLNDTELAGHLTRRCRMKLAAGADCRVPVDFHETTVDGSGCSTLEQGCPTFWPCAPQFRMMQKCHYE